MTSYIAPTAHAPYVVAVHTYAFSTNDPINSEYIPCTTRTRAALLMRTLGGLVGPYGYTESGVAIYTPHTQYTRRKRMAGTTSSENRFTEWFYRASRDYTGARKDPRAIATLNALTFKEYNSL